VFERFTERARQVIVLAQDEAQTMKHNYIGTEHVLIGLLREEEGLAARVLESLGLTVEAVRAHVVRMIGLGEELKTGQIPFTPRAKKALELSLREALRLGHNYIGTEHLLLGLVRETDGVAVRILLDLGADPGTVRNEVVRMLSGPSAAPMPPEPGAPVPDRPRELSEWPHTGARAPRVPSKRTTDLFGALPALTLAAAGFPLGLLVGWLIWG
jgi:ATP-dependent Clp protease ATP-binding subunit ClpA